MAGPAHPLEAFELLDVLAVAVIGRGTVLGTPPAAREVGTEPDGRRALSYATSLSKRLELDGEEPFTAAYRDPTA